VKRTRTAALLVALSTLSLILLAPPAIASDSAEQCVRLRESAQAGGLALDVDNACDRSLTCVLSWTVQCQTERGKVTRSTKDSSRFVVAKDESRRALASAKSCGYSWKIDDVRWDCSPVR
jgi:hypothetical protein